LRSELAVVRQTDSEDTGDTGDPEGITGPVG
jgi:hypothetical protein